ncbi:MAG: hypothetical protein HY658_08855 [Actinobacteria bacterium]|nr:hypothetical protein [Actinomycetota bacterium]
MSTAHATPPPRRAALRLAVPVALAAALAAAGVLAYRWVQGPVPVRSVGGSDEIEEPAAGPSFDFELSSVTQEATGSARIASADLRAAARGIRTTLSELYREAFLDPANWAGQTFDEAWALFDVDAVGAARAEAATLTIGPDAAGFEAIEVLEGSIQVSVLAGDDGSPFTAVALVTFSAEAVGADGVRVPVKSEGEFLLRPSDRGWLIYGWDLSRGAGDGGGADS